MWPFGMVPRSVGVALWPAGVGSWPDGVVPRPIGFASSPNAMAPWPTGFASSPNAVAPRPVRVAPRSVEFASWRVGVAPWAAGVVPWPTGIALSPDGLAQWRGSSRLPATLSAQTPPVVDGQDQPGHGTGGQPDHNVSRRGLSATGRSGHDTKHRGFDPGPAGNARARPAV
jgi:hypothetical protein